MQDRKTLEKRRKRIVRRLNMYYAAEEAVLQGAQSYTIGSRNLTRANLKEIRDMIDELENDLRELDELLAGRTARRAFAVVPRDF